MVVIHTNKASHSTYWPGDNPVSFTIINSPKTKEGENRDRVGLRQGPKP